MAFFALSTDGLPKFLIAVQNDGKKKIFLVDQIGGEGQKAYQHSLLMDYCFIACFLIVMLALSFRITEDPMQRNILICLASARAFCDILENTLLMVLINSYPQQNMLLATVCSWSTTIKFIFMFLWLGMLIFVWILNFVR